MFVRDRTLETYLFFTISIGCREEVYHTILPSEPFREFSAVDKSIDSTLDKVSGTFKLLIISKEF